MICSDHTSYAACAGIVGPFGVVAEQDRGSANYLFDRWRVRLFLSWYFELWILR